MSECKPIREVIVIPPTKGQASDELSHRQLKVASYSRVSTDFEEQLSSFHLQKEYYTDLINRNPKWTLAGTFADEGISGASAEKRPDFMRMIKTCKKKSKPIDLIITKSMSRFARNTLDSIKYVRMLKALGVGVLFEKEGINTLSETSEVLMTILASLAQEELNSLSLNVKMGKRMRMQEGKVFWNYKAIYGFRKGTDDLPEIIPEQAEVIRQIFTWYLAGQSDEGITETLIQNSVLPFSKNGNWTKNTIQSILKNERMCGDVILQKTYVEDPISKKVKVNNGELPKIFIKNNHPAIVDRATFERAQTERSHRTSKRKTSKKCKTEQGKYSSLYAISGMLICGSCGTPYKRVSWRKKNGEKQVVWRCISRLDYGTKYCTDSPSIDEISLHTAIMSAIAGSEHERKEYIPILTEQIEQSLWEQTANSEINVQALETQILVLKEQILGFVKDGTAGENIDLITRLNIQTVELNKILIEHKESGGAERKIREEVSELRQLLEADDGDYTNYNDTLVRALIHTIKIKDDSTLIIYFKCGLEYEQKMELKIRRLRTTA